MTVRPDMATIEIHRENGWVDAVRSWRVLIDGFEVGRLRRLRSATFEVPAGTHTVQMRISLWGSHPLALEIAAGERVRLVCRPRDRFGEGRASSIRDALEKARQWNERIMLERKT